MLKDKVVIVTGGAGLIGKGMCQAIADADGKVVVADVDLETAKHTADKIGAEAMPLQMDITSETSIGEAIEKVINVHGRIDALINSAYPRNKSYGKDFLDVSYNDFCDNVSMHLGGYFLTTQLFCKYFASSNGGSIVNFSSVYGVIAPRFQIYDGTPMTMPVEYAAIKSAVIHLTKYAARYFKGKNIRVNCVSPGGIFDNQPDAFCEAYNEFCSNTGMLDYSDINGAVLFLISDLAKQINGQNIIVDDGFSL